MWFDREWAFRIYYSDTISSRVRTGNEKGEFFIVLNFILLCIVLNIVYTTRYVVRSCRLRTTSKEYPMPSRFEEVFSFYCTTSSSIVDREACTTCMQLQKQWCTSTYQVSINPQAFAPLSSEQDTQYQYSTPLYTSRRVEVGRLSSISQCGQ